MQRITYRLGQVNARNFMPSNTWFFRLSSLALIILPTQTLAVYLHGFTGVLAILALSIVISLAESTLARMAYLIHEGIVKNKLLFIFALWYFVGVVLNSFIRSQGLEEWRLMMDPLFLIIGTIYAVGFAMDNSCHRYFQIALTFALGIQSFFSAQALFSGVGIAREMWEETQGTWVFGNQIIFAGLAVFLPTILWRAMVESRLLRSLLLISCLAILVTILISSFGTPLGLLVLSVPIVVALSLFLLFRKRGGIKVLLISGFVIAISFLGYRLGYDNPFLAPAQSRLETFINDPESGGYLASNRSGSRWYLAEISIHSFQTEPIWGNGGSPVRNPYVGGHSSLFDNLAIYGLLGGGGALCSFILVMLKNSLIRFIHERNWETLLGLTTTILLTIVGIVNPYWGAGSIIFVLILARPLSGTKADTTASHTAIYLQKFHTRKVHFHTSFI